MATVDPAIDWRVSLRRSCLASALGLGELAGLVLDTHARGLRGETREVVEAVRRLLPPCDDETERLTDISGDTWPPPLGPREGGLLDHRLAVALEEPIEGTGWREPHRLAGRPVRFTGPGRRAWLDVPVTLPPASRVELVAVPDDLGLYDHLALEVNGVPVDVRWDTRDGVAIGSASLPDDYAPSPRLTRIMLTTPEPVLRPGPDPRKLGVAVSEVRLVPPAGAAR
jgi:hypothetical protein